MYVGDMLKKLRESIGLSQKELASKIGTTQSSMNRYENNQSESICQVLQPTIIILLHTRHLYKPQYFTAGNSSNKASKGAADLIQ